jgi:hypothetical protein
MQERIENWFWTSTLLLAACGGVDDPSSLAKSRAALAPSATTSTSSASFVPPASGRTCRSDADCAAGDECETEHGQYYCAARHEDKDYYGADAGAPQEECRHHGEDCTASAAPDAGARACCAEVDCDDDEHHGGEYSDGESGDDGHDERDDDDDRSGSNRGPH